MASIGEIDRKAQLTEECAALRRRVASLEAERLALIAQRQLDALAAVHHMSRHVIDSAHEGIIVYGPDLRYQLWNPCMERLSGKKADEVLGKHPFDVFPFLKNVGVAARLEQALAGQVPAPVEFRFDGLNAAGWFLDTSAPLFDESGCVVGVIATVQDVTKRKRREDLMCVHLHLYEFATTHSLRELLTETLDEAERLTGSQIGFYHFVGADQRTLSLQAWSTRTEREFCTAAGAGTHYDINEASVWVDCVRELRPVIHNDYASLPHKKGMPQGHAKVVREVVVPILRQGCVVAILGVGNKETDYVDEDIGSSAPSPTHRGRSPNASAPRSNLWRAKHRSAPCSTTRLNLSSSKPTAASSL